MLVELAISIRIQVVEVEVVHKLEATALQLVVVWLEMEDQERKILLQAEDNFLLQVVVVVFIVQVVPLVLVVQVLEVMVEMQQERRQLLVYQILELVEEVVEMQQQRRLVLQV
tara:strand:- start:66 stop:404 length:339 start_codon:yes stop_codon:yes gene_type:complete